MDDRTYIINFDIGYCGDPEPMKVSGDFFSDDNGYTDEHREEIEALDIFEHYSLDDLTSAQTITRI